MKILTHIHALTLCQKLNGRWHGCASLHGQTFTSLVTDSRKAQAQSLFLALKGERFDAHSFLAQVWQQGACVAIVDRLVPLPPKTACIVVEDTRVAFGLLAKELLRFRRAQSDFTCYAITGSNGKTTCKEILASLLEAQGKRVLKTQGNFNNDIGLPITVMELEDTHDVAILEMGTNAPGEIAYLVDIAEPDVALLTSIGAAHLEGFGTIDGVVKAKGEIWQGMHLKKAILPESSRPHYQQSIPPHVQTLYLGDPQNATIKNYKVSTKGSHFQFCRPEGCWDIQLPLLGLHNAKNFGLCLLAADHGDLKPETIDKAVALLQLPPGRLESWQSDICQILHDAYNANPTSMRAAIDLMAELVPQEERFFILGQMAELGPDSHAMHYEIGQYVAKRGFKGLLCIGAEGASQLCEGAKSMLPSQAIALYYPAAALESGLAQLASLMQPNDTCLIKASRSAALERVLTVWNATQKT